LRKYMVQIVYFAPFESVPSGGVKVIYRHASLINALGIPDVRASVYHFNAPGKVPDWYEYPVPLKQDELFLASRDFVILPECHINDYWTRFESAGIKYGIFVQGPYLIGLQSFAANVDAAFGKASLVLSISQETRSCLEWLFPELISRLISVSYSIDADLFSPGGVHNKVITYMPRRMKDHVTNVCFYIRNRLPRDWCLRAIDGVGEKDVARMLRDSSIFMSFSGLEGLGLPPIEAALSGNRVVGYDGQGGREYWDPALFRRVEVGDIIGFASSVLDEISSIEILQQRSGELFSDREIFRVARNLLAWRFSPEREASLLRSAVIKIKTCMY
jgi:hypothetical protein